MKYKGIPTIEVLKATTRSPERYRVRWDRGSKSFTDPDKTEVMRFATDLVANGYSDPRELGNAYGAKAIEAQRQNSEEMKRTFRRISERYLATLDVTPGYLLRYRQSLEKHVYPRFGDTHINDIRVEHVETAAFKSGLAPSSRKRLVGGLLSPIFDYAIDREWRERANPCRAVSKLINNKHVMQPMLELRDAPMFLDHCYDVTQLVGDFSSLLYGTGLRWQEASALTVKAVDLQRRILRVLQVERDGPHGGVQIATDHGKSDSGFRDIPLPRPDDDPLIIMLKRRVEGRNPNTWLFNARRGGRIYYDLIHEGLRQARTAASHQDGYRTHITPHALRRGFAQAVQDRGASADQIKRLLGHVRLTGATAHYTHDRLTTTQITELQPFVAGLTARTRTTGISPDTHRALPMTATGLLAHTDTAVPHQETPKGRARSNSVCGTRLIGSVRHRGPRR